MLNDGRLQRRFDWVGEEVMIDISRVAGELCEWYANCLAGLEQADILDKCELLLCASDLGMGRKTACTR